MYMLLQVILINLIVSFDNIGVIALATRGLPRKKANTARLVGIWLSLLLKFVFIFFVGQLFAITWLHIRIIGGAMLIYVIYGMFRDQKSQSTANKKDKSFLLAIVTIIAADTAMSLDNTIAVLSVVAAEGGQITAAGLSMAFLGLAISVPILLIFSEAIINLINRYAILFALCAGYLAYIAMDMIFKDEWVEGLFSSIGFAYATYLAILIGLIVVLTSWRMARANAN